MADPNDTLDPEPVDAEFEPADDARAQSGKAPRRGGALGLWLVFLLASLAGGAIGYGAVRYLPPATEIAPDPGAATERAAFSQSLTGLETRLAALEATETAPDLSGELGTLAERMTAFEARSSGNAEAMPVDLSAIDARLTALETAQSNPAAAGATFDPSELEARMAALETALALADARSQQALESSQVEAAPGVDPLILQAMTDRITEIEAMVDGLAPATDTDPQIESLTRDIAALRSELAAIRTLAETAQTSADNTARSVAEAPATDTGLASRQLAARALALTALREIAQTGDGFEAERAALSRLWRENADLAAMADYSRAGVPTLAELANGFPGDAIREAAGPGRVFFGLIEVRRTDGSDSDTGPLAMTGLAERRLAENDLIGAVTIAERLEGEALETVRDWLIQARARLDLTARLQSLREALAASAAEQGSDPT